jgi:hypothetical protein
MSRTAVNHPDFDSRYNSRVVLQSCAILSVLHVRSPSSPLRLMSDSRLCTRCQAIFTPENEVEKEFDERYHYIDGADFIKAAERGCYFCTWTWRKFRRYAGRDGDEYLPIKRTTYEITCLGYDVCFLCFIIYGRESIHPVRSYFRGWGLNSGCEYVIFVACSPLIRNLRSIPG